MIHRWQLGAATAAALIVLAACTAEGGSPASPSRAAARRTSRVTVAETRVAGAIACPVTMPEQSPGVRPAVTAAAPIRPGPVVAVMCQYNLRASPPRPLRPVGRLVLPGPVAGGLATIIDDLPPVQPSAMSCGPAGPSLAQLIRFGYLASPAESAAVTYPICPVQGNIVVNGRALALTGPVADALDSFAASIGGNRGPRTPNLIGLSLASAEAAAKRAGLSVSLSGAVPDVRVPFGTVIFQALPPGFASREHNGPLVRVVVATRSAAACSARQLDLAYRGIGTDAYGSDFGAIGIRNVGSAPCRLTGLVSITGLGRTGRPVTNAFRTRRFSTVILGPHAAPIPDGVPAPDIIPPPPAELAGAIWLSDVYRYQPDSPAGTSCRQRWVIPAAWHVVLPGGLSFTVANADPAAVRPIVRSGAFLTCEGQLGDATLLYYGQPLT